MLHSIEEQVSPDAGDEKANVEAISVAQSEAVPTAMMVVNGLLCLTKPSSIALPPDIWLALLETVRWVLGMGLHFAMLLMDAWNLSSRLGTRGNII
ncbi:MAG: hypothetical protein QM744_12415 [Mesorhizobium sp.]